MRKLACLILTLTILVCTVFFTVKVDASTPVIGIISSDTTWTKSGSPYVLTGPVGIKQGATLTIESGVTIETGEGFYIQVNGTMRALGTAEAPISFLHGEIRFTPTSSAYDTLGLSGSVISHMKGVYVIQINSASPKIDHCEIGTLTNVNGNGWIGGIRIYGGSPTISDNVFVNAEVDVLIGLVVNDGSPLIQNNNITRLTLNGGAPTVYSNSITRGLNVYGGRPIISFNQIFGPYYPGNIHRIDAVQRPEGIYVERNKEVFPIYSNFITGGGVGIRSVESSEFIFIENNLIVNNTIGIEINGKASIQNNTITNTNTSIKLVQATSATISGNNIIDYKQYSVFLEKTASSIEAINNWWGTTDAKAINQSIYDSKKDFTLGTVSFTPYLLGSNPDAPTTLSDISPLVTIPPDHGPDTQIITPTSSPQTTSTTTQMPNGFAIESNSTISAFSIDNNIPQVAFSVSGPEGTSGYVKLTIAKTFMPNSNMKVYLDGKQIEYDLTTTESSWIVTFVYSHSTHQVTINASSDSQVNGSELPSWIINVATAAVAVSVMAAIGILVWLNGHKSKPKQL